MIVDSQAKLGKGFVSNTAKVNGATLHYVRGGKGPPLVLIHGFPQDWFEYHAIMPRLAKRFTVIAVDLRGIGGSKATRCDVSIGCSCGEGFERVVGVKTFKPSNPTFT